MRFQEGDIVKISKKSQYYGKSDNNPADTEGTVSLGRVGHFNYRVEWGEARWAYYNDEDLRLVRRA